MPSEPTGRRAQGMPVECESEHVSNSTHREQHGEDDDSNGIRGVQQSLPSPREATSVANRIGDLPLRNSENKK